MPAPTSPSGHRRKQLHQLTQDYSRLQEWARYVTTLDPIRIVGEADRVRSELAEQSERKHRELEEERLRTTAALREERAAGEASLDRTRSELRDAETKLAAVRAEIIETDDIHLLQQAGVYEYQHPLDNVVEYKAELARLKDSIKATVRAGDAVDTGVAWTVNGSAREGAKMVRDAAKLMLRAYNAEADNLVRTMRPFRLSTSCQRLTKTREMINRLGKVQSVSISFHYHGLRIEELELTADYLAKAEEEKELVRAERERQREEEKARREFEQEKRRLEKERAHYEAALSRVDSQDGSAKAVELRTKLSEIATAIEGVERRAANTRAGYVYIISNIGAFGDRMVKIGMTRRLDPLERVRELGDASVPFRFDVHAIVFSEDAVGLEHRLHAELADQRVNMVNLRREFFYATPAEVRDILRRIDEPHLLEYTEAAEAAEWRASGLPRGSAAVDGPLGSLRQV